MSTLLANMLIAIFIMFWKMQETDGQSCHGYNKYDVKCNALTLQHGHICYDWDRVWIVWQESVATFKCEPQYELRPPNQQVKCQRDCLVCSPYWNGSPPVCQKQVTTTNSRSTASVFEPTTSRRNETLDLKSSHHTPLTTGEPVYENFSITTIKSAAISASTTNNRSTAFVFGPTTSRRKETLDLKRSHHIPLTTGEPVYENFSITTIKSAAISDEKQYLIAVYVTVPIVTIFCLIVLLLLAIRFRRKQQKQSKYFVSLKGNRSVRNGIPDRAVTNMVYDPDVNSATIVGLPLKDENAYASTCIVQKHGLYENSLVNAASVNVNHEITADKSRTADEADYESTSTVKENNMFHQEALYSKISGCSVNFHESYKEYDHLNVSFHAVTDSTYSHTSQTDDVDTYSHTNASDSRSVDKTYNTALSIAE